MRQLVVYGSTQGSVPSDTVSTTVGVAERDTNGDLAAVGLSAGPIPAAAPTSTNFLSNLGALLMAGDTQTSSVSLTSANKGIQNCNATGGPFTLTLPPAASSANLLYCFIKTDSSGNVPTLKGAGTDTINVGVTGANTYTGLTALGAFVALWCDGTLWKALTFGQAAHLLCNGAVPTAAAGASSGTSPPAPSVTGGSVDSAGQVTSGTGTAPSAGPQVAVTFNVPFGATPKAVIVQGLNDASQALNPFPSSITVNGFSISTHVAPAASQPNGTYNWTWIVIG